MIATPRPWAAELLNFWFHRLRPAQWFGRNAVVDTQLQRRFGNQLEALGKRQATEFLGDPKTARAAILLFDQCPRNIHRGDPKAFAFDPLALAICKGVLAKGWDRGQSVHQRQFIAMPLMHSEHIADQLACLRIFAEFGSPFLLSFARPLRPLPAPQCRARTQQLASRGARDCGGPQLVGRSGYSATTVSVSSS